MEDLISRAAMKNMITNHWSDFSNAANYRTALACVDAVPTFIFAQPERKRGKWIHISEEMWKCDQCGEISCCSPKYCPDCGSRNEVTE